MHLVLAVALTIAYPFNAQTIGRADARACFERLLTRSYYGRAEYERAAFLVLAGGELECREWPPSFSFRSETWSGAVPDGTVAIAHTHPHDQRRPSRADMAAAASVGVPVVVVTQSWIGIGATDGSIAFYPRSTPRKPSDGERVAYTARR